MCIVCFDGINKKILWDNIKFSVLENKQNVIIRDVNRIFLEIKPEELSTFSSQPPARP